METIPKIIDTTTNCLENYNIFNGEADYWGIEKILDDKNKMQAEDYPALITRINGVPLNETSLCNSKDFSNPTCKIESNPSQLNSQPIDLSRNIKSEYIVNREVPANQNTPLPQNNQEMGFQYATISIPFSVINGYQSNLYPTAAENQQSVLKMAKTMFSKRTRTLYHWMHPQVPKNHINVAVENAWNLLSFDEKNVYIAQATGIHVPGINNGPMINPHLEKVMPVSVALNSQWTRIHSEANISNNNDNNNYLEIQPAHLSSFNSKKSKCTKKLNRHRRKGLKLTKKSLLAKRDSSMIELESALSSITNVKEEPIDIFANSAQDNYDSKSSRRRRSNPKPKFRTNQRVNFKIEDFENDSELLKELVQFESLYKKKK